MNTVICMDYGWRKHKLCQGFEHCKNTVKLSSMLMFHKEKGKNGHMNKDEYRSLSRMLEELKQLTKPIAE